MVRRPCGQSPCGGKNGQDGRNAMRMRVVGEKERGRSPRKAAVWAVALAAALGGSARGGCSGGAAEVPADEWAGPGKTVELEQKGDDEWAAYLPRVIAKEDGTLVQKTPFGGTDFGIVYEKDWRYYNTFKLNADQRGCISCHSDYETILKSFNHYVYLGKYDNEPITSNDCEPCHWAYGGINTKDALHAHMTFDAFTEMGGRLQLVSLPRR